jgi:hypothetical protein
VAAEDDALARHGRGALLELELDGGLGFTARGEDQRLGESDETRSFGQP